MSSTSSAPRRRRSALPAVAPALAVLLMAGAVTSGSAGAAPSQAADDQIDDESAFLSRVRRLVFEGRRAGEGYFSPDGRQMVFQSEREPGNPFYQIYVLDLETGETVRVSPGTGKTTCPFIRPGSAEILYASTHHDPRSEELQRRSSSSGRRVRSGATRGTTTPRWSSTCRPRDRRGDPPHPRARLRRRGQLLARRRVDRVRVDARRLRPRALRAGARSSSRSTPPTSPRSTSCAPTARASRR
jgi:hypothetical protein